MTDASAAYELRPNAGTAGVGDYWALLKPRVMSLVVFTGLVGLALAPGAMHPALAAMALLCSAVAAGAAGALNRGVDADIDALMERTARRPIPAGRVAPGEALGFGVTLAVGAVVAMGLFVNLAAAALLALTICFYVFVYTMWLKRRTPQNIVIGGAAGAFPPMVGWAAATGEVSLVSLALFAVIFFWTPPHFWALALFRADDYARAGVPMLPVVAGEAETRRQILIYAVILAPLPLLPWALGAASAAYAVAAGALGAAFVLGAIAVFRAAPGDHRSARRLFGFSILYLFLVFALLLADSLVGGLA